VKKLREENAEFLLVGPVIELKLKALKKEGIIISVALPDKVMSKIIVQFSSAVPGVVDILFREEVRGFFKRTPSKILAHYRTKTSVAELLDFQREDKHMVQIGKVKFNVDKLLAFVNTRLKW